MCQNNTDYNDAIKYLETSPMFNLSLSSNELFHSNFLYWIWKADQKTFKSIINKLIGENDYWEKNWGNKNIEVRREYKNFDLSIVEVCSNTDDSNTTEYKTQEDQGDYNTDGLILFVLENKVKSIPYAQQLLKYNNKIDQHNEALLKKIILNNDTRRKKWSNKWGEDNDLVKKLNESKEKICCKKVLLSLTDTSPDITLDKNCFEGWKRRSYDEYLSYLQPINEQLGCTPDKNALSKYQNIFNDYCEYIKNLSICIKEWNKFIDPKTNEINLQTEFGDYPYMQTAENLRLHALYSQYNYAKLCCILMQKLKKDAGLSNVQYIRMQDDTILLTGEDNKKRGKFENYNDYFPNNNDMLIGVGYGYTNKTPLLEVKVVKKEDENKDKLIYIIQVQGNSYEHGIIRKGSRGDVENCIQNNENINAWVSTINDNNINIFADNEVCDKYNGYNGTHSMVYKYRKIDPQRLTKDVIDYIVADVKEELLKQLNQ